MSAKKEADYGDDDSIHSNAESGVPLLGVFSRVYNICSPEPEKKCLSPPGPEQDGQKNRVVIA